VGFLIDSNLWIAVERGQLSPPDLHSITRQETIFVSPINIAEVYFGICLMPESPEKLQALNALKSMRRKPFLSVTAETAEVFGRISADLLRSGRGPGFRIQDVWLASQAIQRRLKFLTANAKDFRDIPGITLVEITLPSRVPHT
jgi:predicted nucleic acid-binding protein